MVNDKVTMREELYERVYTLSVNDVYRFCFYHLKDEDKASEITQQVFLNFYKIFDEVNPDCVLGYLIREAKGLLSSSQNPEFIGEEVKECATSGKN